jgi:hypothetical protein
MKIKYRCLTAVLVLAGCVTETTTLPSGPLTGADAEVRNLVVNVATDVNIAESISEDCPQLSYNNLERQTQIKAVADQATAMLGGDDRRAAAIVDRMLRQARRGLPPEVVNRLIEYYKANVYAPGLTETACRVGNQERRNGTAIGRLLIAE